MKYYMVSVQRCEGPLARSDPRQVLIDKFRRSTEGGDYGSFVGPAPRVTRAAGGPCASVSLETTMTAAWLFAVPSLEFPPRGYYDTILLDLMRGIHRQFQMLGEPESWSALEIIGAVLFPVPTAAYMIGERAADGTLNPPYFNLTINEYSPDVNGSIEWWQSGEAARTATGDRWVADSPRENPIGPNSLIDQSGGPLGTYVKIAAGVTIAVSLAYIVSKLTSSPSEPPPQSYIPTRAEDPNRRRRRY